MRRAAKPRASSSAARRPASATCTTSASSWRFTCRARAFWRSISAVTWATWACTWPCDSAMRASRRVRDALVRLLAGDGEVGVDLGDLGGRGVRGLLDLGVRGEPGLRDGGLHAHARALDAADGVQVPD